jgi:hypothetical protein
MIMCLLFELDDSLVELVAASPFFFASALAHLYALAPFSSSSVILLF